MALPERAFTNPYFIKYIEGATLSRNDRERFTYMEYAYTNQPNREWRIKPQPGYNAQSPSIHPDRVNLSTETPYIRAK
ncbi:MAG: hypothetical protein DRO67_06775 [Candidatus Asgardarchaeum californiense]|nr:MAG: hypothetical protein DRO67_06775 [Candidatus Asgardarchaeum californiense]